jgi:NTE family protein
MDLTAEQPSISETVGAMSDAQLRRYSVDTIALMKTSLERWAAEVSTPEQLIEPYFNMLDFDGIQEPERRTSLNETPTSFSLSDEQVDALIEAGGELLRNHSEFRRLMADMTADGPAQL